MIVNSADPSLNPLHETSIVATETSSNSGSLIENSIDVSQLLLSTTVTE